VVCDLRHSARLSAFRRAQAERTQRGHGRNVACNLEDYRDVQRRLAPSGGAYREVYTGVTRVGGSFLPIRLSLSISTNHEP
jgi:hypothetical protein